MTYEKQQELILEQAALLPSEFGLSAFPGLRFRVSVKDSYVNDGRVILYTEVKRGDKWSSFAKGTATELRSEITL